MDQARKAKGLIKLNLAGDIEGSKKSFHKYFIDKRKARENVPSPEGKRRYLVTWGTEKA